MKISIKIKNCCEFEIEGKVDEFCDLFTKIENSMQKVKDIKDIKVTSKDVDDAAKMIESFASVLDLKSEDLKKAVNFTKTLLDVQDDN